VLVVESMGMVMESPVVRSSGRWSRRLYIHSSIGRNNGTNVSEYIREFTAS
jgi:hypothetical protein